MVSNKMLPLIHVWSDWALLFLRLVFGLIFIVHGLPKLKNLRGTMTGFEGMGFKPGWLWAPLVALVEFFGGVAILLGLGVQAVAALFVIQFLVITVWKVARRASFTGDIEFDLIVLAAAALLFTIGAGTFSLDLFLFGIL